MSSITIENLPFPDLTGVTSLTFGGNFNQPIEHLDLKGVTTLTIGGYFNGPIDKLDLKDVTTLTIGGCFNQPIEKLDLKDVTSLTFGYHFNQPIEHLDLKGVTSITFGRSFNHPIEGLDLKGVKVLTFGAFNPLGEDKKFCYLAGDQRSGYRFSVYHLQSIDCFNNPHESHKYPLSVSSFNYYIERLDLKGVTTLNLGHHFNQPIERLDLKGVTSLTFGHNFNQPIERLDLKKITVITFGNSFDRTYLNHLVKLGFMVIGHNHYAKLFDTASFDEMKLQVFEQKEQIATLTANINGLIHHLSTR